MIKNNNKLETNIIRLFNCYVLSQNQNDKLSYKIKKRLNNKFGELIIYYNNLEGGTGLEMIPLVAIPSISFIINEIMDEINKNKNNKIEENNIIIIKEAIDKILNKYFTLKYFDSYEKSEEFGRERRKEAAKIRGVEYKDENIFTDIGNFFNNIFNQKEVKKEEVVKKVIVSPIEKKKIKKD
jgi:hypothetical protein